MSYKILKQTEKAFEIKHPDGSSFIVPKKGMSQDMMEKISKMPGFANGGEIEYPADPRIPQNFNQNAGMDLAKTVAGGLGVGGYRTQDSVEPSNISPIDFITPGMVTAPAKAFGRGAVLAGQEIAEAAPRMLGNEIGAIGRDVKAAIRPKYQGEHIAPGPENAAIHDLVKSGAYPEDVYSSKAAQYYGHGEPKMDSESTRVLQSVKDKPNATVTIYRAVPKTTTNLEKAEALDSQMKEYLRRGKMPKDSKFDNGSKWFDWAYDERARLRNLPEEPIEEIKTINPGDWVTASRTYAKQHGEGALNGEYKIISKKVKAKEIFTDSNSIHEFGYHPQTKTPSITPQPESLPMDEASRMARAKEMGFDPSKAKSGKISYVHGGIVGEGKNMSYRIIQDSKDHYQVLHPDGSRFTVPKKGISEEMHKKIQGMPKLYDGTPPKSMSPEEFEARTRMNDEIAVDLNYDPVKGIEDLKKKKAIEGMQQQSNLDFIPGPKLPLSEKELQELNPTREIKYPEEKASEVEPKENQPKPSGEVTPITTSKPMDQTAETEQSYFSKIDPYAAAKTAQRAAERYQGNMALNEIKLEDRAQEFERAKENEHKEIQNFINNHQINRGQFWENLGTGGKIQASIALALGGLGAGMTKGPNYAAQIIEKSIEQDIDAQKENRNSGLSTLLQKGKDRDAVEANYRANLIQKAQDMNNLYTAQAKTAEQQAAGQALDIKLQEMKQAQKEKADTRTVMNYIYQKGIPTKAIPTALLMDEKFRQQMVDVDGMTHIYKGRPEGAEIQNKMEANYRPLKDAILRLKEIGAESLIPGTKAYEEAQALAQMLPNAVAGFYSSAIESKRISDTEGHRAEAALNNPTSIMQAFTGGNVRGMTALREMNNIIESSRQQNLLGYEATPKPASTGSDDGKVPLNKVK